VSSLSVRQSEAVVRPGTRLPQRTPVHGDFSAAAQALVGGYRLHGYRRASTNPLESGPGDFLIAELDAPTYGLAVDESVGYLIQLGGVSHNLTLSELLSYVRDSYCG